MVRHPMHAVNCSPAALFRSVADLEHRPTILFDEIDTVFGPKAKDNEELRGFLNAGHRRSGVAYRCVGLGTAQRVAGVPRLRRRRGRRAGRPAGHDRVAVDRRADAPPCPRRGRSSRTGCATTSPRAWPSANGWPTP